MRIVQDAGADGVLVGVPFYFPSTVENAVEFYREIAERFPSLGIMIYHNPTLHHVTLPVEAFTEIASIPNVVGMKDSHRTPDAFAALSEIVRGRISVFVFQTQYPAYAQLGAAGCWSIDAWMGPWPLLHLRNAVQRGDDSEAKRVAADISPPQAEPPDLQWRESGAKLAIGFAGYCKPGPLRPPFVKVPPEVTERAQLRGLQWQVLCERYRALVTASPVA
jgi:dihydrodipicolinate synthase/N-acetylneuraminate lyase